MNIIKINDNEMVNPIHNVKTSVLYDKENAMAVHITLEPGEKLKPHITPADVFFYVLEGKPEIKVGDERVQAEKDSLIESPKNIVHCLYNTGSEKARILVVKAPKPVNKTQIL